MPVLYSFGTPCSVRAGTIKSPTRAFPGPSRRLSPFTQHIRQIVLKPKCQSSSRPSSDDIVGPADSFLSRLEPASQTLLLKQSIWQRLVAAFLKVLASVALVTAAVLFMPVRAAHAARPPPTPPVAAITAYHQAGVDRADATLEDTPSTSMPSIPRSAGSADSLKGVPLEFDDLMKSRVYNPLTVPRRNSRPETAAMVDAIMDQYDMEDFDMGIKQFIAEERIEAEFEASKGRGKSLDERLSDAVFNQDVEDKHAFKTEDVVPDAFTTEVAEEAALTIGEPGALTTAWDVSRTMNTMTYTQLRTLATEGRIDKVRFFGPDRRSALVTTRASAPGGVRVVKVVVPPDPTIDAHLLASGVTLDARSAEETRLGGALAIQIMRYTMPFMVISTVFWFLHSAILDPMPNKFRRWEFIRYHRDLLYVASKMNFRSPARQVSIDTSAPDFISWNDINGIDTVKDEISEIIEYLKDPALLRLRGVARIGGVLLAGAPGTGKTLLAKAIAAESGVTMYTCSGTDFFDVFAGVGARRIRETFDKLRVNAPSILFVDEFDALGAARGSSGSEESSSIINELLVQMDGFEDNKGVVVLGATNRPGAIDAALIRPGRFDRVIYMPLPDVAGRAKILQVHARNKAVDPGINWYEVARAMGGFTGADCMGLMARAARMAGRQGRDMIVVDDIYAALENKAMEDYNEHGLAPRAHTDIDVPLPIPMSVRKAVAVYEAGKALLAYTTPEFGDIARVSVCPMNLLTGYTLFVDDEDRTGDAIVTRGEMESHIVVHLAGRCAERVVMGESEVTSMGLPDLHHANMIAREMIMINGMGRRTGPQELMKLVGRTKSEKDLLSAGGDDPDDEEDTHHYQAMDMSTETARIALSEVIEILEAAEAKAYYGLCRNWQAFGALVQALLDRGSLTGHEVAQVLEVNGVLHFPDPFVKGYGWDAQGCIQSPDTPPPGGDTQPGEGAVPALDGAPESAGPPPPLTGLAAKTWYAGTDRDVPRLEDGKFVGGWHWNTPYSFYKQVPDWYTKEMERYNY